MLRFFSIALVALALVAVAPRPAAADEPPALARARNLLGELRYDDARAALDEALAAGTSGPAGTAAIHRLRGEVAASLDQTDAAVEEFRAALSIDPGLTLEAGASPKLTEPFAAAKASAGPIVLHQQLAAGGKRVLVDVTSDPVKLVHEVQVAYWTDAGQNGSASGSGSKAIEIALPDGVTAYAVAGVDGHGNHVTDLGGPGHRFAIAAAQGEGEVVAHHHAVVSVSHPSHAARTPLYASWILWSGVAVGFAAGGVGFGLAASSAQDELDKIRADSMSHQFSEAQAVEDKARQRALLANLSWGAAGVAAAAAVVCLLYHPSDEEPIVTPTAGDGSVGLSAALRF